jgi:O-antigen biosynthesis protein
VAFPRAVDFGPAACMVLDRAAFVACGGFDARYAPAYYEDADLCFLLAARGLRTVYEPGAKVRHARYASGGSALARELSARNRERFVARWETTLAGRPPTLHPPTPRRVLEARDACADGRFLVLAATPPGDESPLGSWLDRLLSAKPWARVTLLAEDGDGSGWLTRGVELLFGSAEELLRERKLHYDAVFAAETVAPAALAAAAAHQPQAWHARAPNSEPHPHMLARAGLAPQGAQSRVRTRNRRAS